MRTILATILIVVIVQVLGTAAAIYSGVFNVAATDTHWPLTQSIIDVARVRSIKARAAGIGPPANLDDHKRVVAGTSHFAEHCASCHSAPGVQSGELANGMYPQPPVLTDSAKEWSAGELFWIIKNGIKMSGMPAWPGRSDDDLWNIVAFLQKLPGMTEQEYGNLVKEAIAAGGHATRGRAAPESCAPERRATGHC
jgi:mono/diheme cytochrome c family protein